MSDFDPLRAQQRLIAPWTGRPLDDLGVLRVLNENGSKPPLFWIFNGGNAPRLLADALGAEQPLVFSRSSHLLVPPGDDPKPIRDILTTYLMQEIHRNFAGVTFDIGSSCQGAVVAMQLAKMLPEVGVDVGHLCLINSSIPFVETRRPALLVYGDQDRAHDPFSLDATAAHARADAAHSHYKRVVLRAVHGQFYGPTTLPDILAQFAAFKDVSASERSLIAAASSSTVG